MMIDSASTALSTPSPQRGASVSVVDGSDAPPDAFKRSNADRDFSLSDSLKQYAQRGKVPLIVSNLTKAQRNGIKAAAASYLPKSLQSLPMVHGFAAFVPSGDLHKFLDLVPDDAGLCVNSCVNGKGDSANSLFENAPTDGTPKPTETSAVRLPGLSQVWSQGFTGKGQCAAIIDSGIFPHEDLKNHIVDWKDFYQNRPTPTDTYGHGTNVAGVVAGSGEESGGQIKGVAPDASLVGLRVGSMDQTIQALQWVVKHKDEHNIRVVNLSLGVVPVPGRTDPVAQAVQQAIDAGLIVVVSSGNREADRDGVTTPGIVKDAFTVGASDNHGTADLKDDTLADFSLYGSPNGVNKPDFLAPGTYVFAPLSPGSTLDQPNLAHVGESYMALSGTSQSAPAVTGLILDLLQANPKLTREQVYTSLKESGYHLAGVPDLAQGSGEIQADKALEVAQNFSKSDQAAA